MSPIERSLQQDSVVYHRGQGGHHLIAIGRGLFMDFADHHLIAIGWDLFMDFADHHGWQPVNF